MSQESESNKEENKDQSKQDHIKERLKDMGVSQDSIRPERSWFSKYGKPVMLSIAAILIGVFWYESQKQESVKANADGQQEYANNPYYNGQQGYPQYNQWGVPAPWMQEPQRMQQQNNERENESNTEENLRNNQQDLYSNQRSYPGYNQPYRQNYGAYFSAPAAPWPNYNERYYGQPYYNNRQQQPSAYNYQNQNPYVGQYYNRR